MMPKLLTEIIINVIVCNFVFMNGHTYCQKYTKGVNDERTNIRQISMFIEIL